MKNHAGTLEDVRSKIFRAKEQQRRRDANASPEEKLAMLEAMQELANELIAARATLPPREASGNNERAGAKPTQISAMTAGG